MHFASWEDLADPVLLVLPTVAYDLGIIPCIAMACGAWMVAPLRRPIPSEHWLHVCYRCASSLASLLFTLLFVLQLLSEVYNSTLVVLPVALVAAGVSVYGADPRPWQRILEGAYIGTVVVYILWRAIADRAETPLNASAAAAILDATSPSIGVMFLLGNRASSMPRTRWATISLAALAVVLAVIGPFFMSSPSSSVRPLPRAAAPVILWVQPNASAFATLVHLLAILSRVSGITEVPVDVPGGAGVRVALVAVAAVIAMFASSGCSAVLSFYAPIHVAYRLAYLPLQQAYGTHIATGVALPTLGYLSYCASRSLY